MLNSTPTTEEESWSNVFKLCIKWTHDAYVTYLLRYTFDVLHFSKSALSKNACCRLDCNNGDVLQAVACRVDCREVKLKPISYARISDFRASRWIIGNELCGSLYERILPEINFVQNPAFRRESPWPFSFRHAQNVHVHV